MKLPSFQFYPGDWKKDPNLQRCSKKAKGVMIDLMCLLFESEIRGVAITNGRPWDDQEIVMALGGDPAENLSGLTELLEKGVIGRDNRGAIISRRIVRDENIRKIRSKSGSKGGRPTDDKKQNESKMKAKRKQNETPSSSSSSSSSSSKTDKPPPIVPLKGGGFSNFWTAFPTGARGKVGRGAAEMAWKKLKPDAGLTKKIMAALDAQKKTDQWRKEGGQFIPNPATWLNQQRWEDELQPQKKELWIDEKAMREIWLKTGLSPCCGAKISSPHEDGQFYCDRCFTKVRPTAIGGSP